MAKYLNSSEPGCDGSNADIVAADDFERANWYETEEAEDQSYNYGWLGNPFAQARWYSETDTVTQANPAVNVSGGGVGGGYCAQNGGGPLAGTAGTGWSAFKFLGPTTNKDYNELYIRYYTKFLDPSTVDDVAYNAGHLKMIEIEDKNGSAETGFIHSPEGSNFLAFYITAEDQFVYGNPASNTNGFKSDGNEATNQANYVLSRNTWHYIECRIKLNTNTATADGIVEMWAQDAGSDGTNDISNPTKIFKYTGLNLRANDSHGMGQIFFEGWLPSGGAATGTVHIYYDQMIISKSYVGPYAAAYGGGGGGSGKGSSFAYFR